MGGFLKSIRRILGFDVTFLQMVGNSVVPGYICAYVRLPGTARRKEEFGCSTFHDGDVWGIDTNHSWNEHQSIEEREKDAEVQIRRVIQEYKKSKQ